MQPDAAPDDDLADLEAALAEDQHGPDDHDPAGGAIATPDHAPTWDEFVDGWELFRDPILAGGAAGLVLGFLSVYIVLRRMVFVSASVTQAAGFGVAASFYLAARMGWSFDPAWGATAVALVAASLVAPDPRRLGLSREMVLGLTFALFSGLTVLLSARMPQEAHDVQAILFGTAVADRPDARSKW
jgi:zinc transport system permease protein